VVAERGEQMAKLVQSPVYDSYSESLVIGQAANADGEGRLLVESRN
jgi:hypothetical protein